MTHEEMEQKYVKVGKIHSTFLGVEDHGIFTFNLMLNFGGTFQGCGGRALDSYLKGKDSRVGTKEGMQVIMSVIDACGVKTWEELKGRTIYALYQKPYKWNDSIIGIMPLPMEDGKAVIFSEVFKHEN